MDEILVDAITQFLQGKQWLNPINDFISKHKEEFNTDNLSAKEDYSLKQYEIFQEFRQKAEDLLENVLLSLGCDSDTFIKNLEEKLNETVNGPRDEEARMLIETLLTFDDFSSFNKMMSQFGDYQLAQESFNAGNNEVDQTYESYYPGYTENQYGENQSSSAEWILQESIAQSILEAQKLGYLDIHEEELVPWANAIIEMKQLWQQQQQQDNKSSEKNQDSDSEKRLKELEKTLRQERLKVDLLVAQRIAESNAELRKQLYTRMNSTPCDTDENRYGVYEEEQSETNEQEIDRLFKRTEDLRSEIAQAKRDCLAYSNVGQQEMEEIYLFLKEKIHYKYDLALCQEEIYDFISARISFEDSKIISDLLKWLLLEAEDYDIQKRIQKVLNEKDDVYDENKEVQENRSPSSEKVEESWCQCWDEDGQNFYFYNSITNDSSWETPHIGYWDMQNQWVFTVSQEENKDHHNENIAQLEEMAKSASEKTNQDASELYTLGDALEKALNFGDSKKKDEVDVKQVEEELSRISKEHDIEHRRLQVILEVEQARQKQEILRRKEKRRREKAQQKEKEKKEESKEEETTNADNVRVETKSKSEEKHSDQITKENKQKPLPLLSPIAGIKMQPFGDLNRFSNLPVLKLPGGKKVDVSSLLNEVKNKSSQGNGSSLNDTTLLFLTNHVLARSLDKKIDDEIKKAQPK